MTTINTGSHSVLNFYKKLRDELENEEKFREKANESTLLRKYVFSLLLWPRSLLVLRHQAYTSYLHEIEELTCDIIFDDGGGADFSSSSRIYVNLDRICFDDDAGNNNDNNRKIMSKKKLDRTTRHSFTIRYVPNVIENFNIQKIFKKS